MAIQTDDYNHLLYGLEIHNLYLKLSLQDFLKFSNLLIFIQVSLMACKIIIIILSSNFPISICLTKLSRISIFMRIIFFFFYLIFTFFIILINWQMRIAYSFLPFYKKLINYHQNINFYPTYGEVNHSLINVSLHANVYHLIYMVLQIN